MAGEISPIKIAVVLDTAKLETQLRGTSGKISRGLGGNGAAGGVGNGGFGQGKVGGWASSIAGWLGLGGAAVLATRSVRSQKTLDSLQEKLKEARNRVMHDPTDKIAQASAKMYKGLHTIGGSLDVMENMQGGGSPLLNKLQGKAGALLGMFGKPGKALAKIGGMAGGPLGIIGAGLGAAALGVGTLASYNANVTSGIGGTVASFNPRSSIGMNALAMQKAYAATTPKASAGFMASFGASVGPAGRGSLDAMSTGLGVFTNGALWGSLARAAWEVPLGGLGLLAGMDGPTMVPEQTGAKQLGQILKDAFDGWYVRNLGTATEQRQMKRQMQRQANIAERNAI